MASFNIHLAVAKVYLKHNKIKYPEEFIKGILDPDLVIDNDQSHYTNKRNNTSLIEHLKTKINLEKYVLGNHIHSDYQKGIFLHLITDYEFFNNFFDLEYLISISYIDFCKSLYYSYDISNSYLEEKYQLKINTYYQELIKKDMAKSRKEKKLEEKQYENILPRDKLDKWINLIGKINLEKYYQEILQNSKHNIGFIN